MISVVRSTSITEMPSTPTAKWIPQVLIHGTSPTARNPASPGSTTHHSPIETTNSSRKVISVMRRANIAPASSSPPPPSPLADAPCSRITSAPATGSASSAGRIQRSYPIEDRKASIESAESEGAEHRDDADQEHPRVRTDLTGLEPGPEPAEEPWNASADPRDEELVDDALIHARREHVLRRPHGRLHDHAIVDLVDVVLVPENALDAVFFRRLRLRD